MDEQQHQQCSLEMPWNWERETVQKASGRYHTCCSFQFLISLIIGMKTLTVIKPVSIKLEKKSNDIVKAYNMIAETEKELRQMRNNADTVFKAWCASAIDLGSDLGTEPSISRTASRQRHRENTPHDSRKNITVGPCLFLSLTISRKRCHQGKHFKYMIYCISLYLPCQFKVTHIQDKAPLDSS